MPPHSLDFPDSLDFADFLPLPRKVSGYDTIERGCNLGPGG